MEKLRTSLKNSSWDEAADVHEVTKGHEVMEDPEITEVHEVTEDGSELTEVSIVAED